MERGSKRCGCCCGPPLSPEDVDDASPCCCSRNVRRISQRRSSPISSSGVAAAAAAAAVAAAAAFFLGRFRPRFCCCCCCCFGGWVWCHSKQTQRQQQNIHTKAHTTGSRHLKAHTHTNRESEKEPTHAGNDAETQALGMGFVMAPVVVTYHEMQRSSLWLLSISSATYTYTHRTTT